jgi:hypothetical protein
MVRALAGRWWAEAGTGERARHDGCRAFARAQVHAQRAREPASNARSQARTHQRVVKVVVAAQRAIARAHCRHGRSESKGISAVLHYCSKLRVRGPRCVTGRHGPITFETDAGTAPPEPAPGRLHSYSAAHPWTKPRDRTLEELDTAIAATEATAKKVDNLVQDKESRAKSAETRTNKLVAVLNSVCDDCATIPCLLPAVGESSAVCIVCGSSIDRVVREIFRAENFPGGYLPAKKKPSQSELARELASHIGDVSHRIFSSPRKSEFRVIDWRTANLQQGTPTRHQMLSQAEALVKAAKAELAQARQLKTQCDQQKQTLKQEQQQLVARLGGLLGGAKGAKRKASDESCSVCLTATKTHVLIPCGHKCVCDQCARGYRAGSHCPICRGRVQSVVRVFD